VPYPQQPTRRGSPGTHYSESAHWSVQPRGFKTAEGRDADWAGPAAALLEPCRPACGKATRRFCSLRLSPACGSVNSRTSAGMRSTSTRAKSAWRPPPRKWTTGGWSTVDPVKSTRQGPSGRALRHRRSGGRHPV